MRILELRGVSKRFGGLLAVKDVSFHIDGNEIVGLIGPNGAGKTTIFNLISGVYRPDTGDIFVLDRPVTGLPPHRIAHLGVARTHQVVRPLQELTVLENAMVGASFGRHQHRLGKAHEIAEEALKKVGLERKADSLAGSLNMAEKKRLEVARALAAEPRLLLLDEVLAGLNPTEVQEMVEVIRSLRREDLAILIIEHVMTAIMSLSDRIIVLDQGKVIAEGSPQEVAEDPAVQEAYLGDPQMAAAFLSGEGE
ncbi:MAG: ABC transporter ATP-binding protein [Clostridiales bacterium]|nr:ABC transporter ATP-binding protein [Clostridiales bacterium]